MTLSRRFLLPAGVAAPLSLGAQPDPASAARYAYLATDYGARGDGTSLNTVALQRAIDAAYQHGGGSVIVPAGRFLTGTLTLRSHVFLYLSPGSVLLGSTRLEDYPELPSGYRSYTDAYAHQSILYAEGQSNLGLLGEGEIDGQGKAFPGLANAQGRRYKGRPYLIRMVQCRGVRIEGVALRDSAMWVQHYLACEDLRLDGLRVHSHVNGNNDGIDIDSCRNVRVSNCSIFSGDDAIVLKASSAKACENVTVTNCVLSSHCNAFKLGTESNGGFRNITFSNSVIHDTRLSGVAIEMVDGGTLERVTVQGIAMQGVGAPLFVRLGNRARPVSPGDPKPGVGSIRGIHISGVEAAGASPVGCPLSGIPGHPIEDLTLRDVRIRFAGGGKPAHAVDAVPERDDAYPEHNMFGELPAFGIYARHCKGLRMEGIDLRCEAADPRPALVLDDVQHAEILALAQTAGGHRVPGVAPVVLRQSREIWLETRLQPFTKEQPLEVRGASSQGIRLRQAAGAAPGAIRFLEGATANTAEPQ